MRNKKASLEMSIQAIVIVVLAMTLLGLGLGFIRSMFKNISGTAEDVSEQVRQRILDDLIQGDKKISFPKTEVLLNKGEATVLTIGIRNKKDAALHYKLRFTPISFAPESKQEIGGPFTANDWFQFQAEEYSLPSADADVRNIRLKIPSVKAGSYFFTFDLLDVEVDEDGDGKPDVYASKDFFIVVRG